MTTSKKPAFVQLQANCMVDGCVEPAQHRGEVEFYSIYLGQPGNYQWVADFECHTAALNAAHHMVMAFGCEFTRSQYDEVMRTLAPAPETQPEPQPKGHPHAALMAEYAKDAAETDKPWERWEMSAGGRWYHMSDCPRWETDMQYRRKPEPPGDPIHCPFCGGTDIEFVNGISIDPGNSGAPQDLDEHRCRSDSCGRSFWS